MTYPWGDTRRFNSYAGYFRRLFGCRVQKLSVDAGFTCPNRDGTIGKGGCTFCNNGAFTPSYCMPSKSVGQQVAEGIEFHRNRYRTARRYLVYFQSFSNTYAPLERLKTLYDEALAHPDVAGIVVGTRPDCVDERKLDWFASLARDRYVALEYGIESTFDATLRAVNRGHDFACARRAVEITAERGLAVGAHFILGLPGETVDIRDGYIYIDGADTPLDEDYLKEDWTVATGNYHFEVPEDSYLMLGDNRNDSWDARYWTNPYVREDKILGKAAVIYWPVHDIGKLE